VLTKREFNDALVLAAATLVVLPLIPDRHIGLFEAINPRTTCTIVVLILDHCRVAVRHRRGRPHRPARSRPAFRSGHCRIRLGIRVERCDDRQHGHPELLRTAASGAVPSTVATVVRMAAVLAATSLDMLRAPALPLTGFELVAVCYGALFMFRNPALPSGAEQDPGRAFSFSTALLFAPSITAVVFASAAIVW
jgi:uncharacterized membrane protein (DUF4010 family)